MLDGTHASDDQELLEAFVKQFYTEAAFIPARVMLPLEIEEAKIIESWLKSRRDGRKVQLLVPRSRQEPAAPAPMMLMLGLPAHAGSRVLAQSIMQ